MMVSCHKRQHLDQDDADHEHGRDPRHYDMGDPRRGAPRLQTDLFFHLCKIDMRDDLLRQIGESPIGVGNDEKPLDGCEQDIDLLVETETSDMGDPLPGNPFFSPEPPDGNSPFIHRDPAEKRFEEEIKGGKEKNRKNEPFRR